MTLLATDKHVRTEILVIPMGYVVRGTIIQLQLVSFYNMRGEDRRPYLDSQEEDVPNKYEVSVALWVYLSGWVEKAIRTCFSE